MKTYKFEYQHNHFTAFPCQIASRRMRNIM